MKGFEFSILTFGCERWSYRDSVLKN